MAIFEWDAKTYSALPLPHVRWGRGVVEQLDLAPTATVLDLGCGTGRDVEVLVAAHPHVNVVGIDGSIRMLTEFGERLAGHGERVRTANADLQQPLTLDQLGLAAPADAVFSVACFHWIPDHGALFANIASVLRSGGRLVAECGGAGNVAGVDRAIEAVTGESGDHGWNFAGVASTRSQLEEAGFTAIEVRLVPDPWVVQTREQVEAYLATVVLGAELAARPDSEHADFVRAVADQIEDLTFDYVRLQLAATKR
jgi:trans-aconitate 2-methyltransferase